MHPTTSIISNFTDLKLRMQAPALTAGMAHASATPVVNGETITWRATAGAVQLTGMCRCEDHDGWHITLVLTNSGPDIEVRVAYPYLFYHFAQHLPARMFNPLFGGVLEAATCPFDLSYPGPATFCLTAAAGLQSAVAMGVFDTEQRRIIIRHIPAAMDGQIRFVLERALVKQGETLELPVQFVAVGRDWAEVMAPYRDWHRATFTRPRSRPEWWLNDPFTESHKAHCLAPVQPPDAVPGIWIFDNEGYPRTYEHVKAEVDEAVRDGEEKGYKPLFYQFGWWKNMAEIGGLFMFDSLCGDYTAAHEVTRRIIDYIHDKGLRTYLYTNAISAGDETAVFRTRPELFIREANGSHVYNAGYPMLMFCPGAPGIRDYWEENLRYILNTLDADGLFLDQVCGGFPSQYCYMPDHHHHHPDTYGQDLYHLVNFIGERARQLKPDCYVGGELMLDSRAVLLDEAHGYHYTGPKSTPPATREAQRSTPPAEYYIFTRYLCPQVYSQRGGSEDDMMDGAAGSHAYPIWKQYRAIFESACRPCRVDPCGGLAYLFGPVADTVILAVRAHGDIGEVSITLPDSLQVAGDLPDGLTRTSTGTLVSAVGMAPLYYVLNVCTESGRISEVCNS